MFVISDVHGCIKTLEALLKQIPTGEQVVFGGDLIDRGPDPKAVIDLVRLGNYPCVLGNHEDMLLCFYGHNARYDRSCWLWNGGNAELQFSSEQIDWIKNLPLYLEFSDVKNDRGQHLFVSHAAILEGYTLEQACDLNADPDASIIWNRGLPEHSDEKFYVFGHTPAKEPIITESCAMIDTGCVYKARSRNFQYLTAFEFPSGRIIQQENLDL